MSNCRYRIVLPEELLSITGTDLWKCRQKVSHCRYRVLLELELLSILQIRTPGSKRIKSVIISATTV